MSAPTGSDASTDTDGSALKAPADVETDSPESDSENENRLPLDDSSEVTDAMDVLTDRVADWAGHWRAWGIALFSLLVVGWSVAQPEASPKGYIPIFLGFAAIAAGYVFLDEETQVQFASA